MEITNKVFISLRGPDENKDILRQGWKSIKVKFLESIKVFSTGIALFLGIYKPRLSLPQIENFTSIISMSTRKFIV